MQGNTLAGLEINESWKNFQNGYQSVKSNKVPWGVLNGSWLHMPLNSKVVYQAIIPYMVRPVLQEKIRL